MGKNALEVGCSLSVHFWVDKIQTKEHCLVSEAERF
jgi:hypothetical protein